MVTHRKVEFVGISGVQVGIEGSSLRSSSRSDEH